MPRFRKRPVVIEAVQYDGSCSIDGVCDGCETHPAPHYPSHIHTLEGVMAVGLGDWVITGVKGERYPCRADIFAVTYEQVL